MIFCLFYVVERTIRLVLLWFAVKFKNNNFQSILHTNTH